MVISGGWRTGHRGAQARWAHAIPVATRAAVSVSLVRAVEQGRAPVSPAFVSAVAGALGVGVADLLDQPLRGRTRARQLHSMVPALRREMVANLLPPGGEVPRRSLDALAREVDQAARLRHEADLTRLGATLPGLLEEPRAATHILSGSERERAFWLLGGVLRGVAGRLPAGLTGSGLTNRGSVRVGRSALRGRVGGAAWRLRARGRADQQR